MKKKYIISFSIVIIVGFVLIFISKASNLKENIDLKNKIIENIGGNNSIDFQELTDFKWEKLYVFTPYSNPKDILAKDGIVTSKTTFNIEVNDTIVMLGFVDSTNLVEYVELPISNIDANLDPVISMTEDERERYIQNFLSTPMSFSKEESKFKISSVNKIIYFNEPKNND